MRIRSAINPVDIIEKYYDPSSEAYPIFMEHGRCVARKALEIAKKLNGVSVDLRFLEEAAMLHDIGIFMTKAPRIGCFGEMNYICHGYLGRELLEKEGLHLHALVCERHVGVGLSREDIVSQTLPLPLRDMLPLTQEEKIICVADKFFSKNPGRLSAEKSIMQIRSEILTFGEAALARFDGLLVSLSMPTIQ